MAANQTLKTIPDGIYDRFEEAVEAHHQSLDNKAIACLERALMLVRGRQRVFRW
jgi:hypothetical protein